MGSNANDVSADDDPDSPLVDYVGNANVIEASGILGIPRMILVTSVGCGNSREAMEGRVAEEGSNGEDSNEGKVGKRLERVLKEKTRAERLLERYYTNGLWTIVRPGGLTRDEGTNTGVATEDNTAAAGRIGRAEVARVVVDLLRSGRSVRKVLSVVKRESKGEDGRKVREFAL